MSLSRQRTHPCHEEGSEVGRRGGGGEDEGQEKATEEERSVIKVQEGKKGQVKMKRMISPCERRVFLSNQR